MKIWWNFENMMNIWTMMKMARMAKVDFCPAGSTDTREKYDEHFMKIFFENILRIWWIYDPRMAKMGFCRAAGSAGREADIHSVNCSYTYLPARLSTLDKHFLHSCTPTLYYHTKKMQLHIFAPFHCQHWTNISCTIEHQHYIIIQKNKKCS